MRRVDLLKVVAAAMLLLQGQMLPAQYVAVPFTKAAGGGSTPTYIASTVASESVSVTSPIVINYTPSGAGHALYIFGAMGTGTISSLTDSAGTPSVITSAVTWNSPNGGGVYESWLESSASTGSHTITLTAGASSTFGILYVIELSNSSAAGGTSTSSVGNSSANPIPCGSLTTSSGSIALAFAFVYNGGTTLGAGSGPPSFTKPTPSGTGFGFVSMEYSGATTATTYTISSGFVPSGTGDTYFCYAVEAKP